MRVAFYVSCITVSKETGRTLHTLKGVAMTYRRLMVPGMMAGIALVLASPSFADEPRLKGGSQPPVMQELDKMSAEQQQQQREGEQRGRGPYSASEERDRLFR